MRPTFKLYFDTNATMPLADAVKSCLARGSFFDANPYASHGQGRKARAAIAEVSAWLLETFHLTASHEIFFHSGATESVNTFIKGAALSAEKNNQTLHFFFLPTDHACVRKTAEVLLSWGHEVSSIDVDANGMPDLNILEKNLSEAVAGNKGPVILNVTCVNNESGVVWPMKSVADLKKRTGCLIHVDAAQLPGRVADFTTLLPECEAYTFSGHKFGALQGVGFSFIKKDYPVIALLSGSGPQSWIRPGTPNTLGILTLKPAMEELLERFNPSELIKAKEWFESQLVLKLGERGTVVGTKARQRNLNTIMMTLEGVSADVLQQALDHAGIAVSTGAACSSGLAQPSHVLRAMGQSENAALSGVRFSFSPYFTLTEAKESWPVVGAVLEKFI